MVLSFLVRMNLFASFDWWMTTFVQRSLSRGFDLFFSVFSVLGSFDVSCVFVMCFAGYLYFHRKKLGAILGVVSFGFILAFELYGKIFIRHPSPPALFARYIHFFTLPTDTLPHPSYSFPSGHSSRTLFLSTVLLLVLSHEKRLSRKKKVWLMVGLVLYDVIMLVSRVDLGEHWTSDVIGGVFLGIALGSMTVWGMSLKSKTSDVRRKRVGK